MLGRIADAGYILYFVGAAGLLLYSCVSDDTLPQVYRLDNGREIRCTGVKVTGCGLHLFGCGDSEDLEYSCIKSSAYIGVVDPD
jgi:hypothetical protein